VRKAPAASQPSAVKIAAAPIQSEPVAVEWPVHAQAAVPAPQATPEPIIKTETPELTSEAAVIPSATASQTKGKIIMTDALETAKTYAEEAKTRIQSAFVEMNDKAKTAMEKSSKAFEEMGDLTKGNLEAIVESSKIAAKGVESLSQGAADFGRKSFEKTSATMKSFASVKTPAEFFQLQSELMSSMLDSFASESAKSSEAMLKLASEISQPLSNRVSVVTEKMKSIAA
jgi:phasin family protein